MDDQRFTFNMWLMLYVYAQVSVAMGCVSVYKRYDENCNVN